ncbi:SWIM zinc finger domain-containing protein, partial [Pedobacter psychrodurus]|uniref:SWIM zinc finger family protein n=1 Tax=Pedobacter psychrodurus TaxID=2530456 RepID=UPI00292D4B64
MQIPLNEFEQIVDEAILKRGVNYYKRGSVIDLSENASGEYEAIVAGREHYTVRLTIENEIINEHQCDCPYYFGSVCKHVVATIFYLQKHYLQLTEIPQQITIKKKTASTAQQIKALLKDIPHQELIAFTEEQCKNDKKFANYFLATFGYLSKNQSKEVYQKQIHYILRTAAGKYDWIDWSEMKHVVNTLMPFLENANRSLKNRNYENVFFITTALLEEVTDAFQFADDSSGDLGYFIESAMALLSELSKQELSEILRKQVYDYCIWSFNTKKFEGWDWHLGILDLASDLVEKENEADVILGCLDTLSGEYEMEQAQSLKLGLLRRFKSEDEVEKYVGQHISNASIRTNEIEKAFKSNDFDRVIQLSEDGIKCDRKDKPGLV